MRTAVAMALRLAEVDSTVLITGESGTGKERMARLIHEQSARRDKPFIAVNCGAIAENLLESELFGHARGSFTGAIQAHAGIFEAANYGTILLDEIGEISPGMQIKLLRVIQEREVRRVGEEKSRPVDFRVLAATNRDLASQVELGLFRRDLYYRVHVVEIQVPALRERHEDILPLARDLLAESAARMNRVIIGFSPEVANRLLGYHWPGNVRELENAMERAVALARGTRVELTDLPEVIITETVQTAVKLDSVRPLQDISKDYILAALELNLGNQTHTAKQLGIGTATLYRKLKSYGYHTLEDSEHHETS
jgi:transcriptional regulator with PAS, ATPase and Fis domain